MSKKNTNSTPSEEEKEFRRRVSMSEEFQKKLTQGVGRLNEEIEKRFKPVMETLQNEQMPLKRKDIKINGKNAFVSLTKDGRVIFTFGDMNEAEMFYESKKSGFFSRIFKR